MKTEPLVSVNIRTYNSGETLRATLESIKKQSYKNIEIVVSDGHSTDDSVVLAREFNARVDFADKLGDARHQNYKRSLGKYVFSVDSDQILDRKLAEVCVHECEVNKYSALIIAEKSVLKSGTLLEKLLQYERWLIHQTKSVDPVFGTACPRFFEKSLLADVKWPEGISIFDDTILYSELLKKGARIAYISDQFIRHSEVTTWSVLMKKFYRYGKGYFRALKRDPSTIVAHSLPRTSYFSKAALAKPHYFLGLILIYFVKASLASLGALSSVLSSIFSKNKI